MPRTPTSANWTDLRDVLDGERLPCIIVLLDAFDRNLDRCLQPLKGTAKTLRIASKSIRVPGLLDRALARGGATCRGAMTYSAAETAWLAEHGINDLLLAYPTVQRADLAELARAGENGARVRTVVDCPEHLEALSLAAQARGVVSEAVLELDVSWRIAGLAHVGVRRSPIRGAEEAISLCQTAADLPGVRVTGLMAYEAHVAGLPDLKPGGDGSHPLRLLVKHFARPRVAALREEVVTRLNEAGFELELVNGGGTGSLATTPHEPVITEVTAGSALLCPHLFDRYQGLQFEPACGFALQVCRRSDDGWVTCLGGGWTASGAAGSDRLPQPWLPPGLELSDLEGAGEVQTPLRLGGSALQLAVGDPVLFRHAKAGEPMEQAKEVICIQGGSVVDRLPTYRGLGLRFL